MIENRVNLVGVISLVINLFVGSKGFSQEIEERQFTNITNLNNITALGPDGEVVWVGTSGGLLKVDMEGNIQQHYTTIEGLSSNIIFDIEVGPDGSIYVGTNIGLSKLSGNSFVTYYSEQNPGDAIHSVEVSSQGDVWITSTNYRLGLLIGDVIVDKSDIISELSEGDVATVRSDKEGNMWFFTNYRKLIVLSPAGELSLVEITNWPEEISIDDFEVTDTGDVYITIQENGFMKYDGVTSTNYTISTIGSDWIDEVASSPSGEVWFKGSYELIRLRDETFTVFSTNNVLPPVSDGSFFDVMEVASDSSVWIGTRGSGIIKFKNEVAQSIQFEKNVNYNVVLSVAKGADGSVWFGDDRGYISVFDGITWKYFYSGLQSVDEIELVSENEYWLACGLGAYHYKDDQVEIYNDADGLTSFDIIAIERDTVNDIVWIANPFSISSLKDGIIETYTSDDGLANGLVRDLKIDSHGNLWIATWKGISKFAANSFTNIYKGSLLPADAVHELYIDNDDNVWAATSEGLAKISGSSAEIYTLENGMSGKNVTHVTSDESGNIYASVSGGGIDYFDGETWMNFNSQKNNLISNHVGKVLVESSGNIWVTSGNGVSVSLKEKFRLNLDSQPIVKSYGDTPFVLPFNTPDDLPLFLEIVEGGEVIALDSKVVSIKGAGGVKISVSTEETQFVSSDPVAFEFEINKALLKAAYSDAQVTYGATSVEFQMVFDGFLNFDSEDELDMLPVSVVSLSQDTGAGIHSMIPSGGNDNNYSFVFEESELTVLRAPLQVNYGQVNTTYGDAIPLPSFSYEGFVFGQDEEFLDVLPEAKFPAGDLNAGVYDIDLVGGEDDNYELVLISGELIVNKAGQVIDFPEIEDQNIRDLTISLAATSSSGLDVEYDVLNAKIDGHVLYFSGIGVVEVTALQSGNNNYLAADPITRSFQTLLTTDVQGQSKFTESVLMYPIPTTSDLTIENNSPKDLDGYLIDSSGRIYISIKVLAKQRIDVDLRNLRAGLYFVVDNSGDVVRRLIKR